MLVNPFFVFRNISSVSNVSNAFPLVDESAASSRELATGLSAPIVLSEIMATFCSLVGPVEVI